MLIPFSSMSAVSLEMKKFPPRKKENKLLLTSVSESTCDCPFSVGRLRDWWVPLTTLLQSEEHAPFWVHLRRFRFLLSN